MGPRWLLICGIAAGILAGCNRNATQSSDSVLGFFGELMPPSPLEVANDAFNPYDPDQRRRAINLLSNASWGGAEPYMKVYRLMLTPGSADEDSTVRAAALRALGRHGTAEDVKLVTPWLISSEPRFVRFEAATALQRLHAPTAIEPLINALRSDEAADVRASAANALAQYPEPRVFQALVGALHDEDFAVVTESVASLELLTGRKFGEDGAQWLAWSEQTQNLFAHGSVYYYPQYVKPPSFLDTLQFWKEAEKVEPRQPTGLAPNGDGEPGRDTQVSSSAR